MSNLSSYEMAALALDSYQRGYYAGMPDHSVQGQGLGTLAGLPVAGGVLIATSANLGPDVDLSADFFATAYLIENEVVISFRGSDRLNWDNPLNWIGLPDIPLGGEDGERVKALAKGEIPDQILLALDFYNSVKAMNPALPITLTGHSLGGALASAVATLKNADAIVFDNVAFEATTAEIIRMVSLPGPDFDAALHSKVFAGAPTPWTVFGQGSVTAIALENDIAGVFRQGNTVDNVYMGTPLGWIDAHIQGLLVLALFARETLGAQEAWTVAANAVFSKLNDDSVAAVALIDAANGNPASGVMKDMIAHTVLGGDENPFGTIAAYSLINDMQDLGLAMSSGVDLSWWVTNAVSYAALQAQHAISSAGTVGVLVYEAVAKVIWGDFSQAKWTFGDYQLPLDGVGNLLDVSDFMNDDKLDDAERLSLLNAVWHIERTFQGVGSEGFQAHIGFESSDRMVKVIGTGVRDVIYGTAGNEQFLLGVGNDEITPGAGVNYVDGGDGDDTLIDEFDWVDFDISYDASKLFLALRGEDRDSRIHIVENVEYFRFGGEEMSLDELLNSAPTDIVISSFGEDGRAGILDGVYRTGQGIAALAAVDGNRLDKFTWEVLGDGADQFSIDENGIVRVLGTTVIDYGDWRQNVGQITRQQWEEGYLTSGFAGLLNTQYGIQVKVTDASGASHIKDVYFWVDGGNVGNEIYGTPQADTITASWGINRVFGLGGNDHLFARAPNVAIYGGAGDDVLEAPFSSSDSQTPWGSVLYGGADNDTLKAWFGEVRLIGGEGEDTFVNTQPHYSHPNLTVISYETSAAGVTLWKWNITDILASGGDADGDSFQGEFDRFRGSEHQDHITITGSRSPTVWGGGGDDIIEITGVYAPIVYGEDGDDDIKVSGGKVYGGRGNDTVEFLSAGTFFDDDDSLIDADDTVFGSLGDDTIYLGLGSDTFVFQMKGGQDRVHGFTAADTIRLSGIAAFTSLADVAANLYENSVGTDLWMGYTTDHPHAYAPGTPFAAIGKITFVGSSISDVLAAGWEFV